ncbi:glycine betaine ABC transporter substrate-binding protein [Vallitalea okinawensis]|uniref:glycine betaine ABC transporter substrate-binding protein n=1 Tax=Vallitalea okinawensis TaxID=2078660 RepID=UPI00130073E8|nr:glycine betaine ABC transporter substrate-binding protein [Vallitalea okinawensis]
MDKRPFYLVFLCLLIIATLFCANKRKGMVIVGSISNSVEDTVIVGSKPNTEGQLLGEMLTLLIEEYTDLNVEQKLAIGPEFLAVHPALVNKEIDMYPEFTGDAWYNILDQKIQIANADVLYDRVKAKYLEELNIEWLDRYGYNSSFGLAMKRSKAEELGILSYSDLALKGRDLVFGAEFDFYDIKEGYPGLAEMYDFDFKKTVSLDFEDKYDAIISDEVDVIPVFTTDGFIEEYDLLVLDDDRSYFPIAEPATVIRVDVLEKHPELKDALNRLGGVMTAEDITELNYLVDIENMDKKEVAKMYLQSKGLVE